MAMTINLQRKDELQRVSSLIALLQDAKDAAQELHDRSLRSRVTVCIENALKALRGEY